MAAALNRIAAALAGAFGLAGLAAAQVGGPAPAPAGAGAAERQLAPVTITVNRGVAQSAFDTPASVDVVEGAVLRDGQLRVNLSESLARVPGLVVLNRQNYAQDLQISSRGFGARSTFGVRGIRLYVDGIPATAPDGQGQVSHFDLASAARVEVLRGPFSALYGNAAGGVISLFTEEGGPDTVLQLGTAFGSDGVQRHLSRLSGQEGSVRYSVGVSHFATDGWRPQSGAQRDLANARLGIDLGTGTKLTVVANALAMPDSQDPLGLTRAELGTNPRQATPVALQFNTRKTVRQQQLGASLVHKLDADDTLQLTAYAGERGTTQFQSIPVATQTALPGALTQPGGVIDLDRGYHGLDARWVHRTRWGGTPATVTAGLSQEQVDEDRRGFQNFVGTGASQVLGVQGALRRDERNRARTSDAYLQAEWVLGPRWSAQAGLRQSRVALRSQDRYIAPGNGDDSGSVQWRGTTPAAGLVFHASDTLNLYGSVGRGFETPTLNEVAYRPNGAPGFNFGLRPATSRQWELGAKWRPGDWAVNGALFQARTSDELAVLSNTGGRSVFRNAGATQRDGVELSAAGPLGGAWSALLAATAIDARYLAGAAVPAGNRIPGVPRQSLYAELGWTHKPWGMTAALELRRVGRIAVDDANSDFAAASTLAALRLGWTQRAGRWTLREFVRVDNLADKATVGSVIVNEGNRRFFEPAPGRTWLAGVDAAYRF